MTLNLYQIVCTENHFTFWKRNCWWFGLLLLHHSFLCSLDRLCSIRKRPIIQKYLRAKQLTIALLHFTTLGNRINLYSYRFLLIWRVFCVFVWGIFNHFLRNDDAHEHTAKWQIISINVHWNVLWLPGSSSSWKFRIYFTC